MSNQTESTLASSELVENLSSQPSYTQIFKSGLWESNPGLVQLLGLCPLLAVSNTVINGLGLGLATLFTLIVSNSVVSICRVWIKPEVRIPTFVILIASVVTAVDLLMNAWLYDLHLILGIFIPLIVTNCMIIGRAEVFASKQAIRYAISDAIAHGTGFMLVLVTLGAVRELLGHGTLLRDAPLLFGEQSQSWMLQFWDVDSGFLLALLPPGAFILLGLLLALKNLLDPDSNGI